LLSWFKTLTPTKRDFSLLVTFLNQSITIDQ
jgi:hypothetical protein